MFFNAFQTSLFSKIFALVAVFAFTVILVIPPPVSSQTVVKDQKGEIYKKFQEVVTLRADGEYDLAIEKLAEIVRAFIASEEVLIPAYHHLVQTYREKGDVAGARQSAREALERFPDLVADEISFPSYVNDYYDELRSEMFGSLMITEPEECRVFLNEDFVGETPLYLDLVRTGEYDLTVTKSGYQDYTEPIRIQPEGKLEKTLSLERNRDWKWWTYRIGAGVVTVGLLALGLRGGDEEEAPPPPEPLPGPPDPPSN